MSSILENPHSERQAQLRERILREQAQAEKAAELRWQRNLMKRGEMAGAPDEETKHHGTPAEMILPAAEPIHGTAGQALNEPDTHAHGAATPSASGLSATAHLVHGRAAMDEAASAAADEELTKRDAMRIEEREQREAEQLLTGTALPGQRIRWPAPLISDMIHTARRACRRPGEDFGFIGAGWGGYKDNTPHDLIDKLNSGATLTTDEESALEDFFFTFDLLARVSEDAIHDAVERSNMTQHDLALAFASRAPLDRKEKRKQEQAREALALHAGCIGGRFGAKKCSLHGRAKYKSAKERNAEFLANRVVTDGTVTIPLPDAANTLKKRRAELYALAKGLQKHEEADGKEWVAAVCTLPGSYHANPKHARVGHCWNGVTPRAAVAELSLRWSRVRSLLARHGVQPVGLRTLEAHGDATPHLNVLFYYPPRKRAVVQRILNMHFGDTKHALKMNFSGEADEDGNTAQFATYALKYFIKFTDANPDVKIEIEAAWRRTHGIRGYAFYGICSITQWRLLRKSKDAPDGTEPGDLLYEAWKAARNGDFCRFLTLNGGSNKKRTDRPLQTITDFTDSVKPRTVPVGVLDTTTGKMVIVKTIGQWQLLEVTVSAKLPRGPVKPAPGGHSASHKLRF